MMLVAASLGGCVALATGITTAWANVRPGTDQQAMAVARTVGGIISYARWPADRPVLRLCISGETAYAGRLGDAGKVAGRGLTTRALSPGAATLDCDILYLGALEPMAGQRMVQGIRGRAVLTIAEQDRDCRGGAMFCLRVRQASVGFQLSLDAVARSLVRVDPRVLRIANDGAAS